MTTAEARRRAREVSQLFNQLVYANDAISLYDPPGSQENLDALFVIRDSIKSAMNVCEAAIRELHLTKGME
jgi:hypothetical protein